MKAGGWRRVPCGHPYCSGTMLVPDPPTLEATEVECSHPMPHRWTVRAAEYEPVDKPVLKRCPDRRCKVTVHTWTWLTDDGDPVGRTYICRPGAPS